MKNTALIEAESRFAPQVLEAFQHLVVNGKRVSVKVVEDTESRPRVERARANRVGKSDLFQKKRKPQGKRATVKPHADRVSRKQF
jgi:hypothetical protein